MATTDNKRIAKNTVFLYARMLLVMGVALFTSRVVLSALGVDNYGIYNVVGGLSSALIFFSSTLTVSTQRFLNFELGRENIIRVQQIFATCLLIFISISLVVFFVGITLGKWFVLNWLVIPVGQQESAVIVLYSTLICICASFVFSVYESVLIAHENMKTYAYLGVFDVLAKLGISYIIYVVDNKLVVYAWLLVAVQLIPKLWLVIYCIRKYPEVKHKFCWDASLFRELIRFTSWNIYGSIVWLFNGQGINILLNIFFGPVVNAANGIATQVNNAITNFSTNFFTAVRPQIVKRYAAQEIESLTNLIYTSSRFTFYLLWILSLPIILRCDYILSIWLEEVPEYTATFIEWILIYSIVNSFNNPIWTAMTATGNIKRTVLIGSNLFLLAFPLSYLALTFGAEPFIVFPLLSLGRLAFIAIAMYYLTKYITISFQSYFKNVLIPIFKIIFVSLSLGMLCDKLLPQTFISLIIMCTVTIFINAIAIYSLGTTQSEKHVISNYFFKIKTRFLK